MFNQNEQEATEPLKINDEDDFWIQLMCQIYNHTIEDDSVQFMTDCLEKAWPAN